MILSAADQVRFPRASAYVKSELPKVEHVAAIRSAMQTTGQLSRLQFRRALQWGVVPTVQVVRGLGACGAFRPTPGSNLIRVEERLFNDFEAGRGRRAARVGSVYVLGVTILHELVHWGDNLDGVDRPGEEGEEFERLVYGGVIPC